ncbi:MULTISPECIES: glycoside hydrolase family 95 protein [unclassified Sphingobacterium]|uniref:glycoside hydrolase family 95 protein n=1 Tax=unclassified Sphingobacterium TaxID=2609468 RepID=UPI0025D13F9B|nr:MULTISPECIES: glycoside hydrolase family 95 protein [unclassified Sphingobacterium]MDR6734415.1 alpha-L-fucosidase 2 [Sphingobacterium sp. 2149]
MIENLIWKHIITFIGIVTLHTTLLFAQKQSALTLWYDRPADEKIWEQALPLGNGRLGTMFYGIPSCERLQLNEETIWAGGPYRNDNPKGSGALKTIQDYIFDGKSAEAEKLANETFFTKTHGMPYQTAGNILLRFPGHDNYQDYHRELDIEHAVARSHYAVDGVTFTREVFTSFADDVIVMQIRSSKKGKLNCTLAYENESKHTIFKSGDQLVLEGRGTDHEGVKGEVVYQIHTGVNLTDGELVVDDESINIKDATSIRLYISIASNFKNYKQLGSDPSKEATERLQKAMRKDYELAFQQHKTAYNKQFNRFQLHLGSVNNEQQQPISTRIANFAHTQDPALVTLLAQFGRYLLICSSQPGGQPANLQGIWNRSMQPAWDSKYTININTEMNYWPANVTNLSGTLQPLFSMIKELSESGKETAKTLYNASGWVAHHNTDIWRVTSPIDFAAAGMWPSGGLWLSQHVWEHYLFTGDRFFLKQYYPAMKGACDFLLSTLVVHRGYPDQQWLVLSPSISPEQGPLAAGVTMDNQLCYDMLTRTALAAEVLGIDSSYRDTLLTTARRIPPMHIGRYNQLQEWMEDVDDPQNQHRHISHLYGLFPGSQISPFGTPELFEAARNSLIYRGDFATGWSIGWKINLWARLLDGNHAYEIIKNMLTLSDEKHPEGRTYPNLFTAHPPFQIDGNFGLTAGVAEMLVQSHDGAVHLLPAIPDRWGEGWVKGIKARGGFEIEMQWKEGKIKEVRVFSTLGGNLRLRAASALEGRGIQIAKGHQRNALLAPMRIPKPIQSAESHLKGIKLPHYYEYDVLTMPGKYYTLTAD